MVMKRVLGHEVASVAEWRKCLPLKLLAPLHCGSGSNPMRGSCQLLTEGCWFTLRNNQCLQLWKLTAIYNQKSLKMANSPRILGDEMIKFIMLVKLLFLDNAAIWSCGESTRYFLFSCLFLQFVVSLQSCLFSP